MTNKPLTLKQAEQLHTQIAAVKRKLAAEKRLFGDYDDSQGWRYLPPKLYVRLGDHAGGLRYVRWFDKNFPDDIGYPDFLFEWIILLFQNGRLPEAEQKAVQTYCGNNYLFDKFFGRPLVPLGTWEGSNLETPGMAEQLPYSSQQPELAAFSQWLDQFVSTEKFRDFSAQYISLGQALQVAYDYETRRGLGDARRALEASF